MLIRKGKPPRAAAGKLLVFVSDYDGEISAIFGLKIRSEFICFKNRQCMWGRWKFATERKKKKKKKWEVELVKNYDPGPRNKREPTTSDKINDEGQNFFAPRNEGTRGFNFQNYKFWGNPLSSCAHHPLHHGSFSLLQK